MGLSGVVKIEAVVGNDGVAKTVDVKGGHPVLVQAAVDAVHKWRWAPASHDTKEPIEVTFAPSTR
jgi:outer membrane biosynthesis protein TonB